MCPQLLIKFSPRNNSFQSNSKKTKLLHLGFKRSFKTNYSLNDSMLFLIMLIYSFLWNKKHWKLNHDMYYQNIFDIELCLEWPLQLKTSGQSFLFTLVFGHGKRAHCLDWNLNDQKTRRYFWQWFHIFFFK